MAVLLATSRRFFRIHFHFNMTLHACTIVDHDPGRSNISDHITPVHDLHLLFHGNVSNYPAGDIEGACIQIGFDQTAVPDHHRGVNLDSPLHGPLND